MADFNDVTGVKVALSRASCNEAAARKRKFTFFIFAAETSASVALLSELMVSENEPSSPN